MLTPTLFGLTGLAFLVLCAVVACAVWVARKMTVHSRVPVSGHPSRLDLEREDTISPGRSDEVPLSGWYLPAGEDDRCILMV